MGFTAVDATFKLLEQAVSSAKGDSLSYSTMLYTSHQGSYFAHRITLEGLGEDALAQSLSTARVDLNPHEVDAALFALSSPLSKGVLLGDEVGLGKTIEAGLAIAQRWAERKRRILLIVPASLRKQWCQELFDKFSLPSSILESPCYSEARRKGAASPFLQDARITSHEFAAAKAEDVLRGRWDFVVFDEAYRLRNVYRGTAQNAPRPCTMQPGLQTRCSSLTYQRLGRAIPPSSLHHH
jgi:SNF2 family DNA or RNA helicase